MNMKLFENIKYINTSVLSNTEANAKDKPLISFCLPVYNQSQMVKDALKELVKYQGNDIEIVVSDDNSSENIEQIVTAFDDSRIKYYRNTENLGHDLNIINSFRVSIAPYCFLLRVRDRIVPTGIESIIRRTRENPNIAYLTGNAVDERGKLRLLYHRKKYGAGKEAIAAHDMLYFHPSGSLYATHMLDLDRAADFIRGLEDTKHSFIVHSMFRAELACKGDFEIVDDTVIWQYTNTLNSKDVAVNSAERKESVFSPRFMKMRYVAEMLWTSITVDKEYRAHEYFQLYKRYLDLVTWGYKRRNEEESLRNHYNFVESEVDVVTEQNEFNTLTKQLLKQIKIDTTEKKSLMSAQQRESFINKSYRKARFYMAKSLRNTLIHRLYKQYNVYKGRT